MPRIRCHYLDCAFLDENYCSAASIELDEEGCKTYSPNAEVLSDEDWSDEEEEEELEEWEETDNETEDEDFWPDDE
jgi:hypothetical protein